MYCTLSSPVLRGMTYEGTTLAIQFDKYRKAYYDVPQDIGYGLCYSKMPLSYFNKNIRNKFKNEKL